MPARVPDHRQTSASRRRRAGGFVALPAAVVAGLLGSAQAVHASTGYASYEGTFSSSAPAGYSTAPQPSVASSPIEYDFQVTNQTIFDAQLSATVFVERLRSYQSSSDQPIVDISNPAIIVGEDALLGAYRVSGDIPNSRPLDPQGQTIPGTLIGTPTPVSYSESVPVGACGYFAIWVGDSGASSVSSFSPASMPSAQSTSFLNAGVVRVIDGCPKATPRPTPHATGRATPGSIATSSSTPTASATPHPAGSPSPAATARPGARRSPRGAGVLPARSEDPGPSPAPPNTNTFLASPLDTGISGTAGLIGVAVLGLGIAAGVVVVNRARLSRLWPARVLGARLGRALGSLGRRSIGGRPRNRRVRPDV